MADLVLVTGISGFLGGHVALQLLEEGYRVRGSLRNLQRADKVRATLEKHGADVSRLEFVALDLLSDTGWAEAMEGVRYLQHVASPFVLQQPKDRQELIKPAVEGTRRALTAAFAAGVERVVLTSSVAAIVYGHDDYDRVFTTEDWTIPDSSRITAYAESKLRAEQEAWSIADSFGVRDRLVSINPGAIMGPLLDDDPGTSGDMVLRVLNGGIPVAPPMVFSGVDVRDVAAAQVAAMTSPTAGGHRHILAEDEVTIFGMAQAIRPHFPQYASRLPRFELPRWVVGALAVVAPPARAHREYTQRRRVDGSSGRALLDRPMIPATEAAVATAQSLVDQGLVR
jgi:nucleoside-diphosphate-sugar epimerase